MTSKKSPDASGDSDEQRVGQTEGSPTGAWIARPTCEGHWWWLYYWTWSPELVEVVTDKAGRLVVQYECGPQREIGSHGLDQGWWTGPVEMPQPPDLPPFQTLPLPNNPSVP